MASLKDIAAEVGVSIRTVNRALKANGYVRADLRDRILTTADTLGYRPNRTAQSLRQRQSFEIDVVHNSVDQLNIAKIASLEQRLRQDGYSVSLLMVMSGTVTPGSDVFTELAARRPAGAALFWQGGSGFSKVFAQLEALGTPTVAFGAKAEGVDTINIDRQQGVYESVRFLASQGHRRIAYLGIGEAAHGPNTSRLEGYYRAIEELGLKSMLLSGVGGGEQHEQGRGAGHAFADLPTADRPEAIQVYSDVMTLGFLAGLHDRGLHVPRDVAVVGFDDRAAAAWASPPLTTVAQPNDDAGVAAAEILLAKINGSPAPAGGWSRFLPTKLVRRETA